MFRRGRATTIGSSSKGVKSLRIDETRMDDGSIHLFISQAFDELVA